MPSYEFRCDQAHEFEEFRKMAESSAASVCPKCGHEGIRVYHAPSIRIKGAKEAPNKTTERLFGRGIDYINPWAPPGDRVVRKRGSKAERKQRVVEHIQKYRPKTLARNIEVSGL